MPGPAPGGTALRSAVLAWTVLFALAPLPAFGAQKPSGRPVGKAGGKPCLRQPAPVSAGAGARARGRAQARPQAPPSTRPGSRPGRPPAHRPVGTADGPGDVALAIGTTGAAAAATGLWLRSRYRRDAREQGGGS
ncbi:hypothetical protein [Streptomyces sp. NPDC097619]|uniref:hypothetical protein n=1 Tax=Streptomyces sp. NPDC097619 TaxID=3157228 RepID=UPI00332D9540